MMGADLPFHVDVQTVERMMWQLRDRGVSNPHYNIAVLQASFFDLKLGSGKMTSALMEWRNFFAILKYLHFLSFWHIALAFYYYCVGFVA